MIDFDKLAKQAKLLGEAYEIARNWEKQRFQAFIEEAIPLKLYQVDIDQSEGLLALKACCASHARELWSHKDLLAAASPAERISIKSSENQKSYIFKRETIMNSANRIATEAKPDIIQRIEDCPHSAALSTWSDVLLVPNERIILYPDRPTHPDETIILFGHQMLGSMHPEDKAILYRESRHKGSHRMPVRKRYHNGVWGVADMICEFLIFRGHECRFTQVITKDPIDPPTFI